MVPSDQRLCIVAGNIQPPDWVPVLTKVNGDLPSPDINDALVLGKYLGLTGVYAGAVLQLERDAQVHLQLSVPPSTPLWLDGRAVKSESELSAKLPAGKHQVIVRLDAKKLPDSIRLSASEGTWAGVSSP